MSTPEQSGMIDKAVGIVKGLTFANVAVLASLFLMAAPAYLAWRVLNDEALLRIVFSSYEELPLRLSECGVRVASPKAGKPTWFIADVFAIQGGDHWYVVVNTPVQPTDEKAEDYCRSLAAIIEYLRDRDAPRPTYPNTNKPMLFGR